ncbi:MAG: hypothetical protein G8345_07515 [Magnetococcales bacterium]|nr:cupredoxin domain-containing protein [Magnetococcales bacterium]NGZ26722.1 hypothetical protein [Magnetococcales bacterium]
MSCKSLFIAAALLVPGLAMAFDPVADGPEVVKNADWKAMQTITVNLDEHSYEPKNLTLKVGQPYKLVMKDVGEKKHYYTAPEFYKSIATRKAESAKDGEIKAPYFNAFEMMPGGGTLALYFVPMVKGTYPVYCTVDDHRQQGMEGTIVVE